MKVTADKQAFATDHPGYAAAVPATCYLSTDAATSDGGKLAAIPTQVPRPPAAAASTQVPSAQPTRATAPTQAAASPASLMIIAVNGNSPGRTASLTASAPPGARCAITYFTPAGTDSVAAGLVPQTVPANGIVVWSWLIGGNTRRGVGSVTVSCQPGGTVRSPITIG